MKSKENIVAQGKHVDDWDETFMLVPLAISTLLTLVTFFLNFGGESTKETVALINQLAYYSYAWLCCVGLGICVKKNAYLKVNMFGSKYPQSLNKFLEKFNFVLGFAVILVMFVGSFMILRSALVNGTMEAKIPTLPLAIVYFAPVVGFGAGILRYLQRIVNRKGENK